MAKKGSSSRVWLLVHSWLALPIWAFLFFVCLTGTIATVSHEIMWLVDPGMRALAPSDDAKPLGYDALLDAIERQRPGVAIEDITAPTAPGFAATFDATTPEGVSVHLHVDPYTGVIQSERSGFDFPQFIRALHGWLLTPWSGGGFAIGWYLVAMLSLPLLGSLITGLVVYKKFWRGYLNPRLRTANGARIFWGDLHRLAGVWSIPFIAIISLSALWFLIEAALWDSGVSISTEGAPAVVAREHVPTGPRPERLSVDRAIEAAQRRLPGFEPRYILTPGDAYATMTMQGRGAFPLLDEKASVNPYTYELAGARKISDLTGLELVTESIRPLHVGDFGGLWLKLAYLAFGLTLTAMVFSGMMIWTKRTAQATAKLVRAVRSTSAFPEPAQ